MEGDLKTFGMNNLVNSSNNNENSNDGLKAEEAEESDDGKKVEQAIKKMLFTTARARQPKQN